MGRKRGFSSGQDQSLLQSLQKPHRSNLHCRDRFLVPLQRWLRVRLARDTAAPPQRRNTCISQNPVGSGCCDSATTAQNGMRDNQFVAWRTNIHSAVVKNKVFEMNELAGNPHVRNGITKIQPLQKAFSDGLRRTRSSKRAS